MDAQIKLLTVHEHGPDEVMQTLSTLSVALRNSAFRQILPLPEKVAFWSVRFLGNTTRCLTLSTVVSRRLLHQRATAGLARQGS
jgi:hypothetical protein